MSIDKNLQRTSDGGRINDVLEVNLNRYGNLMVGDLGLVPREPYQTSRRRIVKTIRDFYNPFSKNLAEKYKAVENKNFDEKTDKICPKCGAPMIEKLGRFGTSMNGGFQLLMFAKFLRKVLMPVHIGENSSRDSKKKEVRS